MKKIIYVLLACLVVLPFVANMLEQTGDLDNARKDSPYEFVDLKSGVTHYLVQGDTKDPCVVLIHGASGPMTGWMKTISPLVEAGYKVIAYDLFGRGLSDRPSATYDLSFFKNQLRELLQLNCKGAVNLVGSSMGAIIATDYALSYADQIDKIALIGPAGFPIKASPAAHLMQVPVLGEYAISIMGRRALIAHYRNYFWNQQDVADAVSSYKSQFKFRGFKRALLSTVRNMPMNDYEEGYSALGRSDMSVLLIWGEKDVTFPFSNFQAAQRLINPKRAEAIKEAGHKPQYEKPNQVNKILIEYLGQSNAVK